MWQEYARHVYARVGRANGAPLRFDAPLPGPAEQAWDGEPWRQDMACMASTTEELHEDGWLVNQTRMWLASQWAVRAGRDWREGEQEMYRHLLDGSRAANRLGWQWAIGTGTGRVYGFSRWQVEKRAPQLCAGCALRRACPVQDWPEADSGPKVDGPDSLAGGPTDAGPESPEVTGEPEAVWLTAESLGTDDPAMTAHPDLPVVFVFDEPLLRRLSLSGKRLVFLAEAMADLAVERRLEVHLGDPAVELAGRPLATTWTFAPGWKRRSAALDVVALHPWPWLRLPTSGSLRSFSAWAGGDRRARAADEAVRRVRPHDHLAPASGPATGSRSATAPTRAADAGARQHRHGAGGGGCSRCSARRAGGATIARPRPRAWSGARTGGPLMEPAWAAARRAVARRRGRDHPAKVRWWTRRPPRARCGYGARRVCVRATGKPPRVGAVETRY